MTSQTPPFFTEQPAAQSTARRDWRRAAVLVAAGVLAAAGLAVPSASAQQRSQNDGRALDRNTRVGSDGRNEGGTVGGGPNGAYGRNSPQVSGNQIITGNVTSGRHFRGPVGYSDPGAFRGITSGSFSSDRFVRDSAGAPTRYGPEVDLNRPSAYYGSGRAAPPPVGYVPTVGATGGYVPLDGAPAGTQGQLGLTRSYTRTLDPTFRSGELVLPATTGSNEQSTLSASPLYGTRVWRPGESPNDFLVGQREGRGAADRADRFRVDPNNIQRMRDEMNRAGLGATDDPQGGQPGAGDNQDPGQGGFQNNPGQNPQGNNQPGGGLRQPLNTGIGGPRDQQTAGGGPVAAGALTSNINANAFQNSTTTGQGIRHNLLVPPTKQTPQLARLRRTYEQRQQGAGQPTDVQAARQFNMEIRAQRDAAGAGKGPGAGGASDGKPRPGFGGGLPAAPRGAKAPADTDLPDAVPVPPASGEAPAPGATIPGATIPGATVPQPPPPAADPEKIGSIAEGVEAQGLRDVLKSAEDLMKEQQFEQAIQKFDVAQQVAPNNPLITAGRANAELAASYYRRAEMSLRDAVGRAPELVVAQFDLRSMIGEERLQVLVSDLKQLAEEDAKAVRPPLLLAYIAYNTGNEAQAGTYLASAEQRAEADDALLKAWRRNWKIPAGDPAPEPAPAPDQNK